MSRPGWAIGAAAVLILSLAWAAAPGLARPVAIGRHVQVPHGIDPAHPWPAFQGGPARAGRTRHPAPAKEPALAWEARVGIGATSDPTVASDGASFVVTGAGVAGVGPDGEVRWTVRLGLAVGAPALTPEDRVLVASRGGALLHLTRDGEVARRTSIAGGIGAPPLVLDDGSVVVVTRDAAVMRIDTEGRRLFRVGLPQRAVRAPALDARGRIVVTAGTDVRFLSSDGRVRARAALAHPAAAGPAVAEDGTVWLLDSEGTLVALDRHARLRARAAVGPVAASSPLVVGSDGAVRVGTRDGDLVCVGPSGAERWRLGSEGVFLGGLSVDPGGVTLGTTTQGELVAVGADGTVRWKAATRPRAVGGPVVDARGTVYVGTGGGTVQAFR
ncbi:MAG: PQQ-binding-like beta-propeller repeat protein [Myxococcota bacterium]